MLTNALNCKAVYCISPIAIAFLTQVTAKISESNCGSCIKEGSHRLTEGIDTVADLLGVDWGKRSLSGDGRKITRHSEMCPFQEPLRGFPFFCSSGSQLSPGEQ